MVWAILEFFFTKIPFGHFVMISNTNNALVLWPKDNKLSLESPWVLQRYQEFNLIMLLLIFVLNNCKALKSLEDSLYLVWKSSWSLNSNNINPWSSLTMFHEKTIQNCHFQCKNHEWPKNHYFFNYNRKIFNKIIIVDNSTNLMIIVRIN